MAHPGQNLYLHFSPDGRVKIGTCSHCVIHEEGRPERSWNPQGDRELDFDRDALLIALKNLGVNVVIEEEYVCP